MAVHGFLQILMPDMADAINDGLVTEFLNNAKNVIGLADYINELWLSVSEFGQMENLGAVPISAGTYGAVYTCGVAGRCYKAFRIRRSAEDENDVHMKQVFFQIVKEAFIQHFLSQDPVHGPAVPKIYSIAKRVTAGSAYIYIQMDLGNKDLSAELATRPTITFQDFYAFVKAPLTVLRHFNDRYKFVHRDFKLNNILLKYDGDGDMLRLGTYQIIDFGFSCITVRGPDGTEYLIKTDSIYKPETPCREQQDMILFFMFYMDYFQDKSDVQVIEFMLDLIPVAYYTDIMPFLMLQYVAPRRKYLASYNKRGTLTAPGKAAEALTIEYVLDKLEFRKSILDQNNAANAAGAAFALGVAQAGMSPGYPSAGGRRKSRAKRRRTRKI